MNSLSLRKLFFGFALVAAVLAAGQSAQAASVWTGSTNNSITTAGNWNPSGVPGTTIEASFTEFGPNNGSGTNTVNVDGTISVRYIDFYHSNGTIGTINTTTPGVIPNYLFSGTGTINIASNGGIDVFYGQTGTVNFSNSTINMQGAAYLAAATTGGSSNLVINSTNFTIGSGTATGNIAWSAIASDILVNPVVNFGGNGGTRQLTMNVQSNHTITLVNGIGASTATNRLNLNIGTPGVGGLGGGGSGRVIIDSSPGTWNGVFNIYDVDLQINSASALGAANGSYVQLWYGAGALVLNNGVTTNPDEIMYVNARPSNGSAHFKNMPGSGVTTISSILNPGSPNNSFNNYILEAAGAGSDLIVFAGGISDPTAPAQATSTFLQLKGTGNGVIAGPINSTVAGVTLGLVKNGSGAWSVTGTPTYTGTTNVNAGTLNFAPSSSQSLTGQINVADTAALGAKAFSTSGTALTAGTINVGSASGGSALNIGLAGMQTVAPLTVTNLNTAGAANANIINISTTGLLSVGTVPLVDYSGSIGGSGYNFTLGSLPSRVLGSLNNNTGTTTIEFNVTGTDTIRWNGSVNGNWAPALVDDFSGNWKTISSSANTTYLETAVPGDVVTFDDNATGNYGITITSAVTPASATFNANTSGHDYSFSGAGFSTPIFNMIGSQNVSFTNTNIAVTSTFNQSGGILTIANTGSLSLPTINLTGGTLNLARTDAYSLSSNVTGGGTLNKAASGTATLTGTNSGFNGAININNGVLKAGSATALGSASSTVTVNGGTLDLNAKDLGNKVVSISGSGAGGVGAINDSAAAGLSHLKGVVMNADATIGVTGGSSILVDNDMLGGASFTGNGHDLTIKLQGTGGVALQDVGNMGTNNVTVIGVSNSLGIGGNMSLGGTGNLYLGSGATPGWLSINGSGIPEALTVPLSKPIVVPSGLNSIINTWYGNVQIDSTINNGGNLELSMYPRNTSGAIATQRVLTMTGAITGGGTLCMHSSGTANGTWTSKVELTNDSNAFGDVIVGGGGGYLGTTAAIDYMTLSVGNGNSTGSLGTGNVNLVGTGAGVPRLLFNKTGTYTVPNNIITSGIDNRAVVTTGSTTGDVTLSGTISGPGAVQPTTGVMTLTGTNNYTGLTVLSSNSTLKISNNSALGATGNATAGYTDVQNNLATSALSLLGGIDSGEFIWLGGRSGFAAPHIINGSGNNALSGSIVLYQGGTRGYALESSGVGGGDLFRVTGSLRTPNSVEGAASLGGAANVSLQGSGNGLVSGVISEGTINTLQVINIEKNDGGTWTLSGVNTYTGTTNINTGTLALSGSGTINTSSIIAVASGATFDVTGSGGYTLGSNQTLKGTGTVVGNITMSSANSQIAPGMSPGTLNITGDLNTSGGTLNYELTHDPMGINDLINVTGGINASGTTNINIVALDTYLDAGTFPLITYTGTLTGGSPNFALTGTAFAGTRRQGTINTSVAQQINLDVAGGPQSIIWAGGLNSNAWDVGITVNWAGSGDADNHFYNQDTVTFDDTGSVSPSIEVMGEVKPHEVFFTNDAGHDYDTASGIITVATHLTKSGTGNVAFGNSTLNVGGAMTINNTGTVAFTGANTTIGGDLTVSNSAVVDHQAGSITTSQSSNDYAIRSKLYVGVNSSSGTFNQNANVTSRDVLIGSDAGSTGAWTQNAGTLTVTGQSGSGADTLGGLMVGVNGGVGVYEHAGGLINITGAIGRMYVGSDGNSTLDAGGAIGTYNQSSATANLQSVAYIDVGTGNNNTGTMNIRGTAHSGQSLGAGGSDATLATNAHGFINVFSTGNLSVATNYWLGADHVTNSAVIDNAGLMTSNRHMMLGLTSGSANFTNHGTAQLIVGQGQSASNSSTINGTTNLNYGELHIGIMDGASVGIFENLDSATVQADAIRIGHNYLAYDNSTAVSGGQGTFNHNSSGTVNAVRNGPTTGRGGRLSLGAGSGGIGVFNHTGTGNVNVALNMEMGVDGGVGTYNFTPSGPSTLSVGSNLWVGFVGGVGSFTQSNADATVVVGGQLSIGDSDGSLGFYQQIDGTVNVASDVSVGWWGHGEYTMDSGILNTNGSLLVGRGGGVSTAVGIFTQNGGTITTNADSLGNGYFGIGGNDAANGDGTFTQYSGSVTVNNDWFVVGLAGAGHAFQYNDGNILSSVFSVAQYPGSTGDFTQDSNSAIVTTDLLMVGEQGTGLYTQLDGFTHSNGDVSIGGDWLGFGHSGVQGTGVYEMTSGLLQVDGGLYVGDRGFGTLNIHTGGTAFINVAGGYGMVLGVYNNGDSTYGNGVVNQDDGVLEINQLIVAWDPDTTGIYNMNNGTLNSQAGIYIGMDSLNGSMTQTGGVIRASLAGGGSQAFAIGQGATGGGVFTQESGALEVPNDWFVAGVDGIGVATQNNDGTINCTIFALGQGATGNGTFTANTTSGTGVHATDDIDIGRGGIGVLHLIQGTMRSDDWTYVGHFSGSNGTFNMDGGTYNTNDNFSIGLNAGATGNMNLADGVVTIEGGQPNYTGNLIVGRSGSATLSQTGGTIELATPNSTGTINSFSYSLANTSPFDPTDDLDLAQDGNLLIGEQAGTGVVNQSGGTINVAANVLVGGLDVTGFPTILGGHGTLNISGTAVMRVGTTSPTGGDMALAVYNTSTANVNLSGGLLDVSNGSGKIGKGAGTVNFNFTGGTLKVKDFNATDLGGNMGGLVQDGPTSLLDVTGNNTIIRGTYNLKDGTVNTGATRTTTVTGALAADGTGAKTALVTGAGTLNANSGLAIVAGGQLDKAGSGTLRVSGAQSNGAGSTLNATNGAVILNSNAGSIGALNMNLLADGSMTTATLNATQHLASLSATSGALVTLTAPPAAYTTPGYTPGTTHVTTDSLAIDFAGGATVDLGNGAMIVNYSGGGPNTALLNSITAMAANASNLANFSSWDLPGLTSSVAAADYFSTGSLGVGVVDNNDLLNITLGYAYDGITGAQFNATATGEAVSADSILVKLTYYGDSDLNGATDITDYFLFLAGLTDPTNNPANWMNGDYDYSGTVDITDYFYFLAGLSATNTYGDVLSGGGGPVDLAGGGPVAVPEPSSILLLVLGGLGLAWRARGKTRR